MEEKIIKILKRYSSEEDKFIDIKENFDLKNDLSINSGRTIDIIIDLEEEFKIIIDDNDILEIKTYKDIVEIVKNSLK